MELLIEVFIAAVVQHSLFVRFRSDFVVFFFFFNVFSKPNKSNITSSITRVKSSCLLISPSLFRRVIILNYAMTKWKTPSVATISYSYWFNTSSSTFSFRMQKYIIVSATVVLNTLCVHKITIWNPGETHNNKNNNNNVYNIALCVSPT